MRRWTYAHRYVSGEPARLEKALLEHSRELLRAATASAETEPAADGSYPLELSAHIAGVDLDKTVRLATGVAYHRGPDLVLPLTWRAQPAKFAFPTFDGSIELEPSDAYGARLILVGSYRTPLGLLGGLADAVALHAVADHTARRLLDGLARALADAAAHAAATPPLSGPRRGQALRVADVMTPEPLTLDADLPLRTAALLLFHSDISGAPVVTATGQLSGVLSERDLLAKEATTRLAFGRDAAAEDRRRQARTASEACTEPARTTVPDARLADAARAMLDHNISRLVVLDHGAVAGIVTRHDLLAALLREDTDIEVAAQRILDAHGADNVRVHAQWGEITVQGHTHTRSLAERLPDLLTTIDGIMHVNTDDLTWEIDDIPPYPPYI